MQFIVLGDLHYYGGYANPDQEAARDRLFAHFFDQIATLKPDRVFAVGDITHVGLRNEFEGLMKLAQTAGLALIGTMGNHDSYSLSKPELAPFFLGGQASVSDTDLYTHFDLDSTRFLLLDTARDRDHNDWGGWVGQAQLDWLQAQIEGFDRSPNLQHLMVFGHHPLANTTRRSDEVKLNIHNSEQLAAVFANLTEKIGFYFCGHNHEHSIYHLENQPWYYVQTANPLDCCSFRLVNLQDHRVEIETLCFDLSSSSLQEDFETVRQNIPTGFKPGTFEVSNGQAESDRVLTVKYSNLKPFSKTL
jgi:3',5'-cyclic AMP phosphodiesterase CpdA